MKSSFKKISAGILIISVLVLFNPIHIKAQTCPAPGCFDGVALPVQIYCTCSGYYWMIFAPFSVYGIPVPFSAALAVPPVIAFPNYSPTATEGFVGTFVPGVQACYMYAVYGCFPLPTYGMVLPYTGSSLPGGGYR